MGTINCLPPSSYKFPPQLTHNPSYMKDHFLWVCIACMYYCLLFVLSSIVWLSFQVSHVGNKKHKITNKCTHRLLFGHKQSLHMQNSEGIEEMISLKVVSVIISMSSCLFNLAQDYFSARETYPKSSGLYTVLWSIPSRRAGGVSCPGMQAT